VTSHGRLFAALVLLAGGCAVALPGASGAGHHHVKNGDIFYAQGVLFPNEHVRIYSVPPKGGKPTALTPTGSLTSGDPAPSPNGKLIAFDSDRPGGLSNRIYLMRPNGRHQHPITKASDNSFSPSWSPNGKKIVFGGSRETQQGIFIMRADGTHAKLLTSLGPASFDAVWSPSGNQIAFMSDNSGNFDVWAIHPDGSHLKNLTADPAFDGDPAFSPSGRKVIFSSSRTGNGDLYTMNTRGKRLHRITDGGKNEQSPVYSPNGDRLAFLREPDVYVSRPDGSGAYKVTKSKGAKFGLEWALRP
jgi:Tol biopolymer transport system component